MRVSYRWLLHTLGVSAKDLPLAEMMERLTMAGIEVEGVSDLGAGSGRVIAARILECAPHPNADKLTLCRVDAGGAEPLRIVCGAKNMGPGDLVPLAVDGAVLPNGAAIKRSKIRGETSEGMMCSAGELEWGDDASGLLILPPEEEGNGFYRKGEPFDALLDIKVTPNRPDCLSVRGLARELRASLATHATASEAFVPVACNGVDLHESGAAVADHAAVRNEAPEACPRYLGRVIRGVKVGPSPLWLRRAVESAGLRSISNVVDITNYILLESGQPLHAFDLGRVAQQTVVIRYAAEGEKAVTLDNQEVTLTATDLLIADPEKAIALAGVMGCANSEITEETRDIFLECAYFKPSVVRKTSKRLGKSTDSSYRFERGVDWQALPEIVDRAAALIVQVAGGELAAGVHSAGPGMPPPPPIALRVERVRSLLGVDLKPEEIDQALVALGFQLEPPIPGILADAGTAGSLVIQVRVPAFRPDITREVDLIEEVARVIRYDRIPESLPQLQSSPSRLPASERAAEKLRAALVSRGLLESVTYSFVSAESLDRLGFPAGEDGPAVRLRNPLSAEFSVMRPSLLPGLLDTVLHNQNHGQPDVRLFEIGKVFRRHDMPGATTLPADEDTEYAVVVTGSVQETSWHGPSPMSDFFDIKSVAETLLARFGLTADEVRFRPPAKEDQANGCRLFHPGKSAIVELAGETCKATGIRENYPLMRLGELHPAYHAALDLKRPTFLLVGRLEGLATYLDRVVSVREIPAFPSVTRDLALVADKDLPSAEIEALIAKNGKPILAGVRLFDVYQGERLGAGRRSLAYQLRFSVSDRTLTDEEVNEVIEKVLTALKSKLHVELRA